MGYLGKGEMLTNTDLDRFVNNIWEKYAFCVHNLWVQLMKNGGKTKVLRFLNFVQYTNITLTFKKKWFT